jgi:hypothetical protein
MNNRVLVPVSLRNAEIDMRVLSDILFSVFSVHPEGQGGSEQVVQWGLATFLPVQSDLLRVLHWKRAGLDDVPCVIEMLDLIRGFEDGVHHTVEQSEAGEDS